MTEIERMWETAKKDEEHKRVNGSLMDQATFICGKCGHAKETPMKCGACGDPGDCDA